MKNILFLFAMLLFVSPSFAGKIGPAGCGLGNLLFGKDTQILAATTNGTAGNQTFGISSGTSNCDTGNRTAQLENFIEVNQVALANEAARGSGDTIVGLAQILRCSDTQVFSQEVKANYGELFSRPAITPTELSNGLQNLIQKNQSLNKNCAGV